MMSDEDDIVSRIPDLSEVSLANIAEDPQYDLVARELVRRMLNGGNEVYICNPPYDSEELATGEQEWPPSSE